MDKYKDKDWLYSKYVLEGLSSYQIAQIQGCTATTIRNWLKRYGIQTKKASYYQKSNLTRASLQQLYIEEGKTIHEVAKLLDISSNTVMKYLRIHGISSRRVSDYPSFLEGHKKSREKIKGRPRSLQTRLKISKSKTHGTWTGISNEESIFRQYCTRPAYKIWRQGIFQRDDFTCQECQIRGGYLELHHIIPLRDYEKGIMQDNNAITLCGKCHGKTKRQEYDFVHKYQAILQEDI